MIKTCFIGLGSNEPTPDAISSVRPELQAALPGIRFSRLRQTAPVGFSSPRPFYNQVARCSTGMTGEELTALLKRLETAHGRRPEDKAAGIVRLDLDLLCYDGRILKPKDWNRTDVKEGVEELSV